MDKSKLTIPAITLAIGLAGGYAIPKGAPAPAPQLDIATEQLLEHASEDCQARVRDHDPAPECRTGPVDVGTKKERYGWFCNGAWMGEDVQDCLDEAEEAAKK